MTETFNLIIDPSSLPNGVISSNNVTVTILDHDGEGRNIHYLIQNSQAVKKRVQPPKRLW